MGAVHNYAPALCIDLDPTETVTIESFEAGAFEGFGHADFRLVTYEDGEPIVRPEGTRALDLEVELGVVIGRRARRVRAAEAMAHGCCSGSTPRLKARAPR